MTSYRNRIGTGLNSERRLSPSSLTFLLIVMPLLSGLLATLLGGSRLMISFQVSVYSLSVFGLLILMPLRRQYLNDLGWLFMIFANLFWFAFPAFSQRLIPGHWYGDWIEMEIPECEGKTSAVHRRFQGRAV